MKIGCLAVLLTMGGTYAAYHHLLIGTEFEDKWWIAALFALAAGMIIGNIHGLFLAIKQKRASMRQRSEWNDGDLVVVSGRIQSLRSPMNSPFSGTPSVIVEYEIKYGAEDSPGTADYSGFMMTPCSVLTMQGSVNVVGFPLLAKVPSILCAEEANYQKAGEFLKQVKFQEKLSNPLTLLKQINEVFSKNDGEVQAHFAVKNSAINIETTEAAQIGAQLLDQGANLEETVIQNGAEVTVSGTYRANRQAVEIGGGLTDLSHTLELGSAAKVIGGNVRKCLIALVVIGGGFGAGNYFFLKQLGLLSKFAIPH